jgi:hypothetical protein
LFRRKNPLAEFASAVYARTAGQARAPELFRSAAFPIRSTGASMRWPCMQRS